MYPSRAPGSARHPPLAKAPLWPPRQLVCRAQPVQVTRTERPAVSFQWGLSPLRTGHVGFRLGGEEAAETVCVRTGRQASFRLLFPCPQSLNLLSLAIQSYPGDSGEWEERHVFLHQLEQVVLLWKTNAGDKQKKASGGSGPVRAHTDSVPFHDTGSQRWQTQRMRRALGGDTRGPQGCRKAQARTDCQSASHFSSGVSLEPADK